MGNGWFYADNAHGDLRIAMNTLRTIPKMVHSTVFEDDNPEGVSVIGAIVESGLVWIERAIQELAVGFPDVVKYKPYGFCEEREPEKEAPEDHTASDTPEA
jgi:hypothetical protein